MKRKEQNLTVPRMICDKCKFVIPIGAMYWKSDLGRTFCSDCNNEIERMEKAIDFIEEKDYSKYGAWLNRKQHARKGTIAYSNKPNANVEKLEKLKRNLSVLKHTFTGAVNTDDFNFKMESINLFIDTKNESLEILDDLIKELG